MAGYPAVSTRGTHAFQIITFLLEQQTVVQVGLIILAGYIMNSLFGNGGYLQMVFYMLTPIFVIIACVIILCGASYFYDPAGSCDWSKYIEIKDKAMKAHYTGRKIPYCTMYEAYMDEKLEFKQDFLETMLRRYDFFQAVVVFEDLKHYFDTLLVQNLVHSIGRDQTDVAEVYDRGNDFYGFFLGETMKYSCGIFRAEDDNLEVAQYRMLDLVCEQAQMQKGHLHFDFGCGWGSMVAHAAGKFGTKSYGITLSKEQAAHARERCKRKNCADDVFIKVCDYRTVESDPDFPDKFDVITCLEMSEHVGIKNYQAFMHQVRRMLKPEGTFYLQIAGLRRAYQYEDLVWGLFMNKYVFPAADASCPLGFVTSQLERAGFEVHRVENTGVHYSLTIKAWYYNWIANKDKVIKAYGVRYYRMWVVFLGWSTIVAGQGSSTVFMITNTINHAVDERTVSKNCEPAPICRMSKWVGSKPVAVQQ
eukprot:m.19843 g.19843  ORF g.19843 m.19843 type:complete len:476 (-) comp12642_c0_seq1:313-1740(-)